MSLNTEIDGIFSLLFTNSLVPGLDLAEDATFRKVTPGAFDDETQTFSSTPSDSAIKLIRKTYDKNTVSESNGNILTTDLLLYIRPVSGVSMQVMKDDKIIYDSATYNIQDIKEHVLGATKLIYEVQARVMR